MNHNNYANHGSLRKNLVLTTALLVLSLAAFAAFVQPASAVTFSISPQIGPGLNTVYFRDITNLSNTSATVSLDAPHYKIGDTATLTITDINANFDIFSQDTLLDVIVSSSSDPAGILIDLTENGVNTGIFEGTFTLTSGPSSGTELHVETDGGITVGYEPQPTYAGRFKATLTGVVIPVDDGGVGFAQLDNYTVTLDEQVNNCFEAVTDAVGLQLIDLGNGPPTATINVEMSYANAILGPNSPDLLSLYYQAVPEGIWVPKTTAANVANHNSVTKTVSNALPIVEQADGNVGRFVLGYPFCLGGGAGGLVRPGLVLNVLVGITNVGSGGPDHSPPSLVVSRPTSGILSLFGVTAPDPFKSISPTTDSTAPLKINNKGYSLTGYANTIEPEQVSTGENVGLTLSFLEASSVQHVALHFVDENTDEMSDRDPMITFDNGNVIKSDPQGVLGDDITFTTSKDGTQSIFNFGFSFDQPTKRHLMITAWDDKRNSANTKVFDAFDVSGQPIPLERGHLILQDLGQYIITQDGVTDMQAQSDIAPQQQAAWFYANSIGRLDRHDMASLHNTIDNEQARAGAITDNFNLDTETFVAKDVTKPYDTSKRAPELTWSNVGHKLRHPEIPDEENELLKQVCWQEHLKAEKRLKSLLVGSKYQQD